MGLFDQAKDALAQNKDKIDGALHSEKAEQVSDTVIEKGTDFANNVTGGKFTDQINQAGQFVDGKIGTEGEQPTA